MMKHEFEKLAGRQVTAEQYKAIETLYTSSDLNKQDFVKNIKSMLKTIPQPEKKKTIVMIGVTDRSGYYKTPNGCWYHTYLGELVGINIKTGKMQVKKTEDSYDMRGVSFDDIYIRDYEIERQQGGENFQP